jgi:hypothetical protein
MANNTTMMVPHVELMDSSQLGRVSGCERLFMPASALL